MKAIVCTRYGTPDVLQLKEVEKPTPKDNEVLIRVYATTATAAHGMMRKGRPFIGRFFTGLTRPKNPIPGTELAGKIEAVGKDVKLFKAGDQVFGETGVGGGCYAEYICLPEGEPLAIKPANLTYGEVKPRPSLMGHQQHCTSSEIRQISRADKTSLSMELPDR
jgi:NADPH:quinone reductase-like Zn-dependent oxidoreductase